METWEAQAVSIETAVAKVGIKATLQTAAIIVLSLVLLITAGVIWWHWDNYQKALAYKEAAVPVANVTSAATDALTEAASTQQTVRVLIDDKRTQKDSAYEELLRRDENARTWADTPIPDSVRQSDSGALDRSKDNPARGRVANPED